MYISILVIWGGSYFLVANTRSGRVGFFTKLSSLKRHQLTHEDKNRDSFTCELCGSIFNTVRNFNRHQQIHNGVSRKVTRLLECDQCQKKFRDNYNLKRHMMLHSETSINEKKS